MIGARALQAARVGFVVLAIGFATWGLRGRWEEIGAALAATSPTGLLAAVALVAVGLSLTGLLWRRLLSGLGSTLPPRTASGVFFVGQIGKYIPGSVWSFAAQARLAGRHGVRVRRTVAASVLFLVLHTTTGALLGTAAAAVGVLDVDGPRWVWALAAVGCAALLPPAVVRGLGGLLAGGPLDVEARDVGFAVVLMSGVWLAYGTAVLALLGPDRADPRDLPLIVAAFALSHVAGVLLVIAPAGLGAREAVLTALLAPVAGLGAAVAVALLARVVHTVADFAAAGVAWLRATRAPGDMRGSGQRAGEGTHAVTS